MNCFMGRYGSSSLNTSKNVCLEVTKEQSNRRSKGRSLFKFFTMLSCSFVAYNNYVFGDPAQPYSRENNSEKYRSFEKDPLIFDGYGEFLVYNSGSREPISEESFDAAYTILEKYRPHFGAPSNRLSHIRNELLWIDPHLEVSFIPRTLYELLYIREAIEEDMKSKTICDLPDRKTYEKYKKQTEQGDNSLGRIVDQDKCWHLCHFTDETHSIQETNRLRHLAYRLNNVAIKKIHPSGPYTASEIRALTRAEVEYLKNHRKTFDFKDMKSKLDISYGPTISFGCSKCQILYDRYCGGFSTTISDDSDAKIIFEAIDIECSESAIDSFVLYRGGELFKPREDTSISFGASLFAGSFLDPKACAFFYTSERRREGNTILVPTKDLESPFWVPISHPIQGILSRGDLFHPRTLLAKEARALNGSPRGLTTPCPKGLNKNFQELPSYLFASYNHSELVDKIDGYFLKAIPKITHPGGKKRDS